MMSEEKKDHKNKAIILSVCAISLVFLSSVTSVPLIHGSTAIQGFEENQGSRDLSLFLSPQYIARVTQGQYMMNTLTNQIIQSLFYSHSPLDVTPFQMAANNIYSENLNKENSVSLLHENTVLLSNYILDQSSHSPQISSLSQNLLTSLQGIIDQLSFFLDILKDRTTHIDDQSTPWITNQNLVAQNLINLVMLIILIILFLLDGGFIAIIMGAASGILSAIVFVLGAIAGTIILLLLGLQGILSFAAIFVFLLGILSKVVINVLSTLGAPLLAYLTWKLTGIIGGILGHVSLALLSLAALLLLLGLPIAFGLVILALAGGDGGDTNTTRLPVIMELVFSVLVQIPGLEEPLQNLWMRLGERIDTLPEWPFDTPV
jgi:hypothetical protein